MVNTSKILGRLREQNKTQADLASYMGMAQSTVNQKMNGKRPLFLDEAEKIACYLNIPDSEFCLYFFSERSA